MRFLDGCKSAGIGALLSIVLGVGVFVFGGRTVAVSAYLFPGVHMGGFLSPVVPSSLTYWIEPAGGPYAFLVLSLVCSALLWAVLFGSIHYAWARRRRHP